MASEQQVAAVGRVLVDPKLDLTQRFRALFTLRNLGGKTSTWWRPTFFMCMSSPWQNCCHISQGHLLCNSLSENLPQKFVRINSIVGHRMFNGFRPQTWLRCCFCPGADAIEWIGQAFADQSALLKHELAYCLGQMQDTRAIPTLTAVLKDKGQEAMVRHEAGMQAQDTKVIFTGFHATWWGLNSVSKKICGY